MYRPRIRDASAVQGVYLTIGLSIAAFFPFLALYLRDAHGLDESQIGVVLACMAAARMLANPLWGHLSDTRIGRLTALQIGLAVSAAAAFMLNAAAAVPAITLLIIAQAVRMAAGGVAGWVGSGPSSGTRPGHGGSWRRRPSCGPGSTRPGTSSARGSRIRAVARS